MSISQCVPSSFSCCIDNNSNSLVPTRISNFNDKCFKLRDRKLVVSSHLVPGSYVGNTRQLNGSKVDFVRTLLIDNYDSYTYNIFQELSLINGVPPVVIRNDEWSWEDVCYYLYEQKAFDNIVISPGPGSPSCDTDIGICLRLLHECRDIPILGVCLGHQALGYVHGAQVVHAPEPVHGRLSDIEHNGCGLFHGIPSGQNSGFKVVRYHSLVIDPSSLPRELIPIAWTSSDTIPFLGIQSTDSYTDGLDVQANGMKCHVSNLQEMQCGKIIMGIMHSSRPHYGVQFHPESIATCHGSQIFSNFAEITKEYWFRSRSSLNSRRNAQFAGA